MYKAISDYGLIGDMHTAALVSTDGSIDYCSMPHLDSPTVFAALLDDKKGGTFRISPEKEFTSTQEYIKDTNVLKTTFKTGTGTAELVDFMPVDNKNLFHKEEHLIHRCLKVGRGRVDFVLTCSPRPFFAKGIPDIINDNGIFRIKTKGIEFVLRMSRIKPVKQELRNGNIILKFTLKEGEAGHFEFATQEGGGAIEIACDLEAVTGFWRGWLHDCVAGKCAFLGEYSSLINRSLLTLKLLSFQPTGAIAAAATTSLPESIGGSRNWDYRFTWIRDASFTLKALYTLGHISEADSFVRWLHETYRKHGSNRLQIMYSLSGESEIKERVVKSLEGYMGSRPVRDGNEAYAQKQWDIYGEVMNTALRLSDYVGKIDAELWPFFRDICNMASRNWKEPDSGIWEVRDGPHHFVYSKAMCWVALDRGVKIARRYGFDAPIERWVTSMAEIKDDVLKRGYDTSVGSFVQRYGSKDLDSSLLLLGIIGFLPMTDERIRNTVMACKKELMKDGFLMRYTTNDGINEKEGSFLLCNFWLVESLTLLGDTSEAKRLLKKTLEASNHLGLFSEEFDPITAKQLGNTPQAFSHIGYINAVAAILTAEKKMQTRIRDTSIAGKLRKLAPINIILNRSEEAGGSGSLTISADLKIKLNHLQGAFFSAKEGTVNYSDMKLSQSYREYIEMARGLASFDLSKLKSDYEKKAFWINIYNILIIHGVIDLDITSSVKEVFNFFGRIGYTIGGYYFTPDDIEHGILRKNAGHPVVLKRQFLGFDKRRSFCLAKKDPRIHFALVCASSSCPPIEFYDAARIDDQLDAAGRSFINRYGIQINRERSILLLSQVFKWYRNDFGKNEKEMIQFIMKFADSGSREYVAANLGSVKVEYLPYDWNLNNALK